jgi:hypothetical protein
MRKRRYILSKNRPLDPKDLIIIATNAPWYVGNRQIQQDLGIPFFSDQTTAQS